MVRWGRGGVGWRDWRRRGIHRGPEHERLRICSHSTELAHSVFQNTASLFSQFQPRLGVGAKVQRTSKFIFEIKVCFLMEFLKGLLCRVCAAPSLGGKAFLLGP